MRTAARILHPSTLMRSIMFSCCTISTSRVSRSAARADSDRYEFENDLSDTIVEIGLRLADVEAMDLEAKTAKVDNRQARRDTLERHGAIEEEIDFLAPEDEEEPCQRVELNAMTSRQVVDFVDEEAATAELPDDLEERVRRVVDERPELSWDQALAEMYG